jgi:hypothetical protein
MEDASLLSSKSRARAHGPEPPPAAPREPAAPVSRKYDVLMRYAANMTVEATDLRSDATVRSEPETSYEAQLFRAFASTEPHSGTVAEADAVIFWGRDKFATLDVNFVSLSALDGVGRYRDDFDVLGADSRVALRALARPRLVLCHQVYADYSAGSTVKGYIVCRHYACLLEDEDVDLSDRGDPFSG